MKDIIKEKDFGRYKFQFEFKTAPDASVKYFIPGAAFTRRKNICFAIVVFLWHKRMLFRLVIDTTKAAPCFNFNKRVR